MEYVTGEFVHHHGEMVTLVRQFTQTQSDAWNGKLEVIKDGNSYKYQVQSVGKVTLFSKQDVLRVENPPSYMVGIDRIFRLTA